MKAILILAVFLICHPAQAQQVMDGSASEVTEDDLKDVVGLLMTKSADPFATQFVELRLYKLQAHRVICGKINLKGKDGIYKGFRKFQSIPDLNHLSIGVSMNCK